MTQSACKCTFSSLVETSVGTKTRQNTCYIDHNKGGGGRGVGGIYSEVNYPQRSATSAFCLQAVAIPHAWYKADADNLMLENA